MLLHVKGIAPRIGKALAAGSVALAGARWVDHKDETYTAARATPGSRGAYGYLPSGSMYAPAGEAITKPSRERGGRCPIWVKSRHDGPSA